MKNKNTNTTTNNNKAKENKKDNILANLKKKKPNERKFNAYPSDIINTNFHYKKNKKDCILLLDSWQQQLQLQGF